MYQSVIEIDKAATILKLLGDKTRLSMVALLNLDECCVCEFVEIFGMSQPAISQHLRKLKDVGIITEKRSKHWVFYSLNKENEVFPIVQSLLDQLPDQQEKLKNLEAKGLRISCCD